MTADYRAQALQDPSTVLQELYRAHATTENFPRFVAEHFSKLFESPASFKKVCSTSRHVRLHPHSHMTFCSDT